MYRAGESILGIGRALGRGGSAVRRFAVCSSRLEVSHLPKGALTVPDHASRYLLGCESLSSTGKNYACTVLERLFQEPGLPANLRSHHGAPFASAPAFFHLSKRAGWWLRRGIGIERIQPGPPQHNGRHERMPLTLKKGTTQPAAAHFLPQQARFDDFIAVFHHQRPHQARDMKYPAELYQPSLPPYPDSPTSTLLSTIKPSCSPVAAASVWARKQSTSARSLPGRPLALSKSTTISGSSVLWIMI